MFLTKPFVKCLRSEKVANPSRGWERGMVSYECPIRRGNTLREKQWGVGSYLKGYTYHSHIKCYVANLSAALMKR